MDIISSLRRDLTNTFKHLKSEMQKDETKLFSVVPGDRTCTQTGTEDASCKHKAEILHFGGGRVLDQAAWRGCEVPPL